jgi:hypothetical protein
MKKMIPFYIYTIFSAARYANGPRSAYWGANHKKLSIID